MKPAALPLAAILAAGITIAGASFLAAQDAAKGADPVIARVDGTEIRESDLALAEDDIGSGLQPSPPEIRRETLLTYLIDVAIIAKAAVASGADGVFLEFHPDPDKALCDPLSCLPLDGAAELLKTLKGIHALVN